MTGSITQGGERRATFSTFTRNGGRASRPGQSEPESRSTRSDAGCGFQNRSVLGVPMARRHGRATLLGSEQPGEGGQPAREDQGAALTATNRVPASPPGNARRRRCVTVPACHSIWPSRPGTIAQPSLSRTTRSRSGATRARSWSLAAPISGSRRSSFGGEVGSEESLQARRGHSRTLAERHERLGPAVAHHGRGAETGS